jgi:hypothetical protein
MIAIDYILLHENMKDIDFSKTLIINVNYKSSKFNE